MLHDLVALGGLHHSALTDCARFKSGWKQVPSRLFRYGVTLTEYHLDVFGRTMMCYDCGTTHVCRGHDDHVCLQERL